MSAETKSRVHAALCSFIVVCATAWTGSAQPAPQPRAGSPFVAPESATALVDSIEREWPSLVERDPRGHVVSLTLSQQSCNDSNLALVAQIGGLRQLRLQGGKPTTQGLRLLRGNTNLSSLRFACFFRFAEGLLTEATDLPQIQQLRLYYSDAAPSEYAALVRMTNLADLQIVGSRNFGDTDLSRLTNAPALRNLTVTSESLTRGSAALLSQFRALTNAELVVPTAGTGWRTNWHPAAGNTQAEPERK